MIMLKIWQLAELAIPLLILLIAQTVFMILYARFVVFPIMGHDYDAAVITAGTCHQQPCDYIFHQSDLR